MKYTLIDGEARNIAHPGTLQIPSLAEREAASAKVGQFVKLGFQAPGHEGTERMWVEVTGPGKGLLNNDPVFLPIECGDPVEFEPKHVLSILED